MKLNIGSKSNKKNQISVTTKLIKNTLRATIANERKNWKLSIPLWEYVIEKSGADTPVEVFIQLSNSLRATGDSKKAEQLLSDIVSKHANNYYLNVEYAIVLNTNRKWREASQYWNKELHNIKDSKLLSQAAMVFSNVRSVE